jgi:uncharacterized protein (TIGR02246 family)
MRSRRFNAVYFLLVLAVVANVARADDNHTIKASADAFVAAFNKGDANAVAAMWTDKGVLVDELGRRFEGRPQIEAAYVEFFKAHPGVQIKVTSGDVRKLMGDSLLEEGTTSLTPAPAGTNGESKYSAVHVQQNGQWLMSNVREWPPASPKDSKLLKDFDWLVGTWTAEERGAKSEVVCRWLPNNSYLERRYKVTAVDGKTTEGVQLIGLNPHTGQVVSWGFGFDGGHTIGAWVPRPNGWGIDAAGITPDGVTTHAMNLFTKLDNNAFSWQSVDRTVAGQSRPNTDEIIFKRSEAKK